MKSVQLELFPPEAVGAGVSRARRPWKGQSPRELTRAFRARTFGREGMGRLDLDARHVGQISEAPAYQLELFPFVKEVQDGSP